MTGLPHVRHMRTERERENIEVSLADDDKDKEIVKKTFTLKINTKLRVLFTNCTQVKERIDAQLAVNRISLSICLANV